MFKWLKDKFKKSDEKTPESLEDQSGENQKEEGVILGKTLEDALEEQNQEESTTQDLIEEDIEVDHDGVVVREETIQTPLEKIQEEDVADEDRINTEDLEESIDHHSQEEDPNKAQEPVDTKEDLEVEKQTEHKQEFDEEHKQAQQESQTRENGLAEEDMDAFKEEKKQGFFQKLKSGLTKTRKNMGQKINQVLGVYVKVDEDLIEDLEDVLISSDLGMETTMIAIDRLKDRIVEDEIKDPKDVLPALSRVLQDILDESSLDYSLKTDKPSILLVVGVNGVGKTTTIGKLSARLKSEGKTVLLAAADTFRAAAIDQLKTWGQRAQVDVISHSEGADPAAVTYDAIQAAKARDVDVLIIDTAGRLHNKSNLMKELEKISRIIDREYPQAHRENLLVLDATTGQNAILQAKTFNEATNLTGFILTKLDGTAKGGVVIGLQRELGVPIKLIGVGEQINDLQYFDSKDFSQALFEGEDLEKNEKSL